MEASPKTGTLAWRTGRQWFRDSIQRRGQWAVAGILKNTKSPVYFLNAAWKQQNDCQAQRGKGHQTLRGRFGRNTACLWGNLQENNWGPYGMMDISADICVEAEDIKTKWISLPCPTFGTMPDTSCPQTWINLREPRGKGHMRKPLKLGFPHPNRWWI